MTELNKVVWLYWKQGWENAPWIVKQVKESWEINIRGNINYKTI